MISPKEGTENRQDTDELARIRKIWFQSCSLCDKIKTHRLVSGTSAAGRK